MGAGSAGRHPSIKIMAISAEAKDRPLKSSAVPPPDNPFGRLLVRSLHPRGKGINYEIPRGNGGKLAKADT
jgi:hypothetical protein